MFSKQNAKTGVTYCNIARDAATAYSSIKEITLMKFCRIKKITILSEHRSWFIPCSILHMKSRSCLNLHYAFDLVFESQLLFSH